MWLYVSKTTEFTDNLFVLDLVGHRNNEKGSNKANNILNGNFISSKVHDLVSCQR